MQKAFQSPRSGKFESNELVRRGLRGGGGMMFQSPRSGKFESNGKECKCSNL